MVTSKLYLLLPLAFVESITARCVYMSHWTFLISFYLTIQYLGQCKANLRYSWSALQSSALFLAVGCYIGENLEVSSTEADIYEICH